MILWSEVLNSVDLVLSRLDEGDRMLDTLDARNLCTLRDWAATPLRKHRWQFWLPVDLPPRPRLPDTSRHRAEVARLRANVLERRAYAVRRMRELGLQ